MEVRTETKITSVTLTMEAAEAKWLMALMKNPFCSDCGQESKDTYRMRQTFFYALEGNVEEKCEALTFHGINKQAAEINSALDNENERLTWKLEIAQKALREITEAGGLYYGEKEKVEYCIARARLALEEIE